ncbi:integrase [Clostridium botulinum]|nr:integrase [Clostridium botulinum]NFJ91854.1 integrase [Clostridium botulinum]NFR74391.1 integrase [Clostridium botulinum]
MEEIYIMSNAKISEKEQKDKINIDKNEIKIIKKAPKKYRKYLIEFIEVSSQEERNLKSKSKSTIDSYLLDIVQFLNFINYKDKELLDITSRDIEAFKKSLLNKKRLKVKTVNRKLTAINQFLKANNIDIMVKQLVEQKQNYLNNILSKEEIERMLKCCKSKRNKAIISTLYLTGVRVSELLQLTVHDVNKKNISIRGKGGKYRDIFVTKKLNRVLNEYLEVRREDPSDKLFIGISGPLKRRSINRIIKKYAAKAGVKKNKAHPHNFRHVFCKNLADKKVSIEIIADLAGHTDLNTTRIYTKQTKEELINILEDM